MISQSITWQQPRLRRTASPHHLTGLRSVMQQLNQVSTETTKVELPLTTQIVSCDFRW